MKVILIFGLFLSSAPFQDQVHRGDCQGGHVHQPVALLPGASDRGARGKRAGPRALPELQADARVERLPGGKLSDCNDCHGLGGSGSLEGDGFDAQIRGAHGAGVKRGVRECPAGERAEL